jgi:hypothetical protein
VVDVGAESAEPDWQVGEKPEIPPQMVLEGDAGRPGGDVVLDDREARAVRRQETRIAVPVVDRGEPADQPLGVGAHARLPARDVAGVEDDVH